MLCFVLVVGLLFVLDLFDSEVVHFSGTAEALVEVLAVRLVRVNPKFASLLYLECMTHENHT